MALAGLLVAGALVMLELVAPSLVEAAVEDQVAQRTPAVTRVTADVSSFPLVSRMVATGEMRHLEVALDELVHRELTFASLRLTLEGIRLDRAALAGGDVAIEGIARGEVVAEVTEASLVEALGVPAELGPGGRLLRSAAETLAGRLLAEAGALVVDDLPEAVARIPLPEDLIPCVPDIEVTDGRLVLRCTFDSVPGPLTRRP